MDSILTSIKKMLGIEEEYTHFDDDIMIHVNSALMVLNQLGIGPDGGFDIADKTSLWSDYIGTDTNLQGIKTYIFLKVRLIFDPPSSAFLVEIFERHIKELEWRLMVQKESITEPVV